MKIGWILRTFKSRETFFMKLLWKQLLQPHVDYLERLEISREHYTRKIHEMKDLDYWSRLKALKIYSQERRIERYRIIYTWKIIEGLVPNFGLNASINERLGRFVEIEKLNIKSNH